VERLGLLCLVAIGFYFAWGAKLEAEYERRVQALRDGGDHADEPRSWYAEIPAEENAAAVLTEAAELLERLQRDDEELRGVLAEFTFWGYGSEVLDPEGYERLRKEWPKLNGYFALLEAAARRPVFAPPPLTVERSAAPFCGTQDVTRFLQLRAHMQPETAPESVRILLSLAARWRPGGGFEMRWRSTVRGMALEALHGGLREGTLEAAGHREAWERQLAAWDAIATLRERLQHTRREQIRFFQKLREGTDPFAEGRKEIENNPILRVLYELPWYARWYGRPVLHREGLKLLDEAKFAIGHATSERALREALRAEHSKGGGLGKHFFRAYARVLEHLTEVRLARIAMALQVDAQALGGPRESLDAHAPVLGRALLEDPFTGEPFLYERHDEKVVLRCSVGVPGEGEWESLRSRLLEGWLFNELLTWEVRWAPAKQGD
jgi:hypothetical protein